MMQPENTNYIVPYGTTEIRDQQFNFRTDLMSVIIPDTVTSIGRNAFRGCSNLSSITIPDSVTSIGRDAFDQTIWYNNQPDGLVYAGKVAYKYKGTMPDNTSIILKKDTKGISGGAFAGCAGLTSITVPDGVININSLAFHSCVNLKSIVIPYGVMRISGFTFAYCCNLIEVTIPDSVLRIDWGAFEKCKCLLDINYLGTKAQWKAIKKWKKIFSTDNWDRKTGNYTIHCTDGII